MICSVKVVQITYYWSSEEGSLGVLPEEVTLDLDLERQEELEHTKGERKREKKKKKKHFELNLARAWKV